MAETPETAVTTGLTLDDIPNEFEFDTGFPIALDFDIDVCVELKLDGNFDDLFFSVTTCALGEEEGGPWEADVAVIPYPSPDPETPVVSDPA